MEFCEGTMQFNEWHNILYKQATSMEDIFKGIDEGITEKHFECEIYTGGKMMQY